MKRNEAWYNFWYFLSWPFFNLFHPARVIGRENIPEGGVLICANHTKMCDPFYVIYAFQHTRHIWVMAKAEVLRLPVIGPLVRGLGAIGIERGKSDVGAIKTSLKCLKSGQRLLVFPEGTRMRDGETGEGKAGAAMLAVRSGVPILPIYIPAKKRWFRPTPVVIGQPYRPEVSGRKGNSEEYRDIAEDLMERIRALEEQAR